MHDARPQGKFREGSTAVQELDAASYRSRSVEGSGLAGTSPRTRGRVSFTDARRGVAVLHAGPSVSGDKGLGGPGVQEGYKVVAAGCAGPTIYFNPSGEGGVSAVAIPLERPGPYPAASGGGERDGVSPGEMAEASTRRSCFEEEWKQELIQYRDRGRGWGGCADLVNRIFGA